MGKKAPTKAVAEEKPEEKDVEEKAEEKAEEKEVEEKEVEEKAEEKEAEEKEAEEKDTEEKEEDGDAVKPVENGVKDKKGKKKGDSKKIEKEKGGKKKGKQEDKEEDEEEDGDKKKEDEDEGESSEEELGTLEKPIEILTNKRDRKSTERFIPKKLEKKEDDDLDYTEGNGVVLADIAFIKHKITEADAEDLEVIHKLMYRKSAKQNQLKKNILKFQGYPFGKDHKYYKSAKNMADRLTLAGVRWISGTLGLTKSKERDEMADALMEFMNEPKDLELPVPAKRTVQKSQKSSRRGKRTPKRAAKDPKKKMADSDEDDDDDDDDVSEASSDAEESEEEEKPAAKSPAKKTAKKKATPVKISLPSKKRGKRKSAPSESDSDEDDEPLVKKKKATPTDAELKKAVSTILKDADLEEVTMKNVVRQVYDKYPSFDLSSRKDYIKSTVKQMIS